MPENRRKYVPPSLDQLSFSCPHCGAFAKQFWFTLHAESMKKDDKPVRLNSETVKKVSFTHIKDEAERTKYQKRIQRYSTGRPGIEPNRQSIDYDLDNVSLSRCYSCNDIAIWINDRLAWPSRGESELANADLPADIHADYNEASAILDASPRGAAALLRLGIQKICKHLGEKGENINEDIAALVKRGLDIRVQQALDVVRVVGNNAIHPGQIDLRDDRATAEKLFGLVNLITDIMISQPKHIKAMFDGLPEGARKAIEKRDGQK